MPPVDSQVAVDALEGGAPGILRRSAVIATLLASPHRAEALFGFDDGPVLGEPVTAFNVFNVSMPRDFRIKDRQPSAISWSGDRVQPLESATAAVKVVKYTSLADAFGANVTEVGERLAAKRLKGKARLVEAKMDPTGAGLDAYAFEFDGDILHELELVVLTRRGSESVLCNLVLRTPRLLWEDRSKLFPAILGSFTLLEATPSAAKEPAKA